MEREIKEGDLVVVDFKVVYGPRREGDPPALLKLATTQNSEYVVNYYKAGKDYYDGVARLYPYLFKLWRDGIQNICTSLR